MCPFIWPTTAFHQHRLAFYRRVRWEVLTLSLPGQALSFWRRGGGGGTQQQLLMLANQSLFPDDLPGLDAWKTSHHEWGTLLQQGIRNRNIGVEEHKLSNN